MSELFSCRLLLQSMYAVYMLYNCTLLPYCYKERCFNLTHRFNLDANLTYSSCLESLMPAGEIDVKMPTCNINGRAEDENKAKLQTTL